MIVEEVANLMAGAERLSNKNPPSASSRTSFYSPSQEGTVAGKYYKSLLPGGDIEEGLLPCPRFQPLRHAEFLPASRHSSSASLFLIDEILSQAQDDG